MAPFSLEDLPRYSPWPARLLGLTPFVSQERTLGKLLREYDTEKYPELARFLDEHPHASLEDIRLAELGLSPAKDMSVSRHGTLSLMDSAEAHAERSRLFLDALAPHLKNADTVLDLGAGYGYNLARIKESHPALALIGGEMSDSACALARRIAPGIDLKPFNLFDEAYAIFDAVPGERILVLTSHAVEMMPEAGAFIERLLPHAARIHAVAEFEPLYERASEESLLGLMRRRYIELNRYNRDLFSALEAHSRVAIETVEDDFFGLNPLFPESLIVWRIT